MNEPDIRLIQAITFCKKIGKLTTGFDVVKESVKKKESKLVLLAKDLSDKTRKEVVFLCEQENISRCETPLTMDEYWYLLGKRVGVLAVLDATFAEKIKTILSNRATP